MVGVKKIYFKIGEMAIPGGLRSDYVGIGPCDALISHAKGSAPVEYAAMVFEDTIFIYKDASTTLLVTLAIGTDTSGYMDAANDVQMEVESHPGPVPAACSSGSFTRLIIPLTQTLILLSLNSKWQRMM